MIVLPMPPSLNTMYRATYKHGTLIYFKSKQAKEYMEEVGWMLNKYTPLEGEVDLEVWCYFKDGRSDADSRLKSLLDVLQGKLYVNDNQIYNLVVHKRLDKSNPRIEIALQPSIL